MVGSKRLYDAYETEKYGLWDIFNLVDKFYVPTYQRDFSWTEEQVTDFLDTVEKLESEEFYLGAIVLAEKNVMESQAGYEKNVDQDHNSLFIVDGQQRLTVICLLTHCMLERLASEFHPHDAVQYYKKEDMKDLGENPAKKHNNAHLAVLLTRVSDNIIPEILLDDEKLKLDRRIKLSNSKHEEVWPLIFNTSNIKTRQKSINEKSKNKVLTPGDKLLWGEYKRIYDRVHDWEKDKFIEHTKNFFEAGTRSKVHAVVIKSDYLETGVNIFYGMNTKGLQLEPADLIKANLCVTAGKEFTDLKQKHQAEVQYVEKWEKFEKVFADKMHTKPGTDKFRDYLLDWIVSRHHEDEYLTKPTKRRISKTTLLHAYNKDLEKMESYEESGIRYLGIDNTLIQLDNSLDTYVVFANLKIVDQKNKDGNNSNKFSKSACPDKIKLEKLNVSITRMHRLIDMTQHRRIFLYVFNTLSDDPLGKELKFKKNIDWLIKIVNLVASFLIRIKIISVQAQSFRPWINGMLENAREAIRNENDTDKYGQTIFDTLNEYIADKITNTDKVNLSDETVKRSFVRRSYQAGKDQKLLKSLLWEIECEYRVQQGKPDTINEELKHWDSYHLEHIYPQNDNDAWKKYYDVKDDDPKSVGAHSNLFDSRFDAGNATLWHKDPNIAAGTQSFSKKIIEFKKREREIHGLINDVKISDKDDGWTKESMDDLSTKYADLIIDILNKLSK